MMNGRDSTIDNIGITMHDMAIYVRWRHLCHMHELYVNAAKRFFFTVTSRDRGYSRRAVTRKQTYGTRRARSIGMKAMN